MGVVYEAHDPALDRIIALKTINLSFALSGAARIQFEDRFFFEARISGRLSHPGIVAVHDAGRDPESGLLYIALERLDGLTLAEIARPIDWREALRLTRSVAVALDYAHEHGVVHRDIKPANIMRLPTGETKLMDFGIARIESARGELSGAGELFGTPLYMAPELTFGSKLDARADLFSLGAVCYALLTGRDAFAAETIPAIVARIAHHDPEPPSSLVPQIPAGVDALIARVLAKDPQRRHSSARDLAEHLEDVLAERRARHVATVPMDVLRSGLATVPDTVKLDLEPQPAPAEAIHSETASDDSPLASLLAEIPGAAPSRPSVRASEGPASRRRTFALAAVLLLGVFPALLPSMQSAPPPAPAQASAKPSALAASAAPGTLRPDPVRAVGFADLGSLWPTVSAVSLRPAAAAPPPPRSAWLLVDFKHPVERARLRLWVGGKELLDERPRGELEKRLKLLKVREGELEETLELAPGRHEIKVAVSWDDQEKRESIFGDFRAGQAKHLEVRLGRLRKNLSVDWR